MDTQAVLDAAHTVPTKELGDIVNDLDDAAFKLLENRLRRMADRQRLHLIKSRVRDPRAVEYGTYELVDENNFSVAGGHVGMDVVDVIRCLLGIDPE